MKKIFSKIALAATFGFALAFTLSCSSSNDGDGETLASSSSVSNNGGSSSSYETVVIGTQTWLKRNLNVMSGTGNSWCYRNCDIYGRLYDWAAAMALPSCNSSPCANQINTPYHRGICPIGFHIPTNAEWDTLFEFVADENGSCAGNSCYGSMVAKFLKTTSEWKWNDYEGQSGSGTDDYGFSALPGGCSFYGDLAYAGEVGVWWSADEYNSFNAYYQAMGNTGNAVLRKNEFKAAGFSVRCLKND